MKERCECVYELAAVKRAHIPAAIKKKKKKNLCGSHLLSH